MNSMKRQKDTKLRDELSSWVGALICYWEEWSNSSRSNEEAEPKRKQCPAMDVSGGKSQVRCYKE